MATETRPTSWISEQTAHDSELQAAVLMAQLRKLPPMLDHLRANKQHFKRLLTGLPGLEFREVLDSGPAGGTRESVPLPQ